MLQQKVKYFQKNDIQRSMEMEAPDSTCGSLGDIKTSHESIGTVLIQNCLQTPLKKRTSFNKVGLLVRPFRKKFRIVKLKNKRNRGSQI